jgi:hypothetical protein
VEACITSLRSTLDFVREQDQREREEKILLHRPRAADAAPQPQAEPSEIRRVGAGNA